MEVARASTKSKEVKEVVLVPDNQSKTARIVSFLREHVDMFAWKLADMPSIPRELIEHSLNVSAIAKLIK